MVFDRCDQRDVFSSTLYVSFYHLWSSNNRAPVQLTNNDDGSRHENVRWTTEDRSTHISRIYAIYELKGYLKDMGNAGSSNNNGGRVHTTTAKKQIDAGDMVPNVTLKVRIRRLSEENKEIFEWRDVQSFELFRNKKIVMFAIAGAFSTVCACDHIPSFQKHYDEFIALGVDEIYCIAVNDAFVIRHFGLTQGLEEENEVDDGLLNPGNFKKIRLIPDGSARFTRAMGMSCRWDNMAGFGERSWRYSAYIDNGQVIKMFKEDEGKVEDDSRISPAQLLVADGTTMLTFLKGHLNNASAP